MTPLTLLLLLPLAAPLAGRHWPLLLAAAVALSWALIAGLGLAGRETWLFSRLFSSAALHAPSVAPGWFLASLAAVFLLASTLLLVMCAMGTLHFPRAAGLVLAAAHLSMGVALMLPVWGAVAGANGEAVAAIRMGSTVASLLALGGLATLLALLFGGLLVRLRASRQP